MQTSLLRLMMSSLFTLDTWDKAAEDLEIHGGVATIELNDEMEKRHKEAFRVMRLALNEVKLNGDSTSYSWKMDKNEDSAHATGYHGAGTENSLSRYNAYREGFVFSDGALFDIPFSSSENNISFQSTMSDMYQSMHDEIANNVLKAIARRLSIESNDSKNDDWFQQSFGPTKTSSQWHMKQYIVPKLPCSNGETKDDNDVTEWLPMHTDPSLISVIIHDSPGKVEKGMGLQYQAPNPNYKLSQEGQDVEKRIWKDIPAHGHAVATIFVGSVLSYITGGMFPSVKHRVIYTQRNNTCLESGYISRVAATLFVRPQGSSLLRIPPCPILLNGNDCRKPVKIRRNCKFQDWLSRVSKNYMKKGKPTQKNNKKGTEQQSKQIFHIKKATNPLFMDDDKNGNNPIHWEDEFTELTLLPADSPILGQEKFLGGEQSAYNQRIYTVPGHAPRVLEMDITKDPVSVTPIGPVCKGEFKWLRGVSMPNGVIYAIPCHSNAVLKIDSRTNTVSLLSWDENAEKACPHDLKWKYHGAVTASYDGCVYCIPQAAQHVLKLDPRTDEITFIGPPLPGKNKWYGGVLGKEDGAIYGICQNATGILRIDAKLQKVTVHGNFPEGGYKWHGAVNDAKNSGNIYGIPNHFNRVLKIEPGIEPRISLIGPEIPTGKHRKDDKYRFLGGAVGGDKHVYLFPSDADHVYQIDTSTDEVRPIGQDISTIEPICNNRWQNGFTASDGSVYGIPLKGSSVLRILIKDGTEPQVSCIGGPYTGLNKWEGGVSASNGEMFCMPLNCNYSLRIRSKKQQRNNIPKHGDTKIDKIGGVTDTTKEFIISDTSEKLHPRKNDNADSIKYTKGSATLRSSAHTLRYSATRAKDKGPNVKKVFPEGMRGKVIIPYKIEQYNLRDSIVELLLSCDQTLVGKFSNHKSSFSEKINHQFDGNLRLEDFQVPDISLMNKKSFRKNGRGELAQKTLSDIVAENRSFLFLFDQFVEQFIVPFIKMKLICNELIMEGDETTFFYQRPPTLRIQPGPSDRGVPAHSDATYGHQDGELNFWMPLTDPLLTETDLWAESAPGKEDFAPLGAKLGELVMFHGSSCRHYVPPNPTHFSRVSIDFRVGVKDFFDPVWKMRGTKSDHDRKEIRL